MNFRRIFIQLFILFVLLLTFSYAWNWVTRYHCESVGKIVSFDVARQTLKTDLVNITAESIDSSKSKTKYAFYYYGEYLSTGQELFVCSNGKFYTQ